jgi:uncharacterized membrane protein
VRDVLLRAVGTPEGKILIAGVLLAAAHVGVAILISKWDQDLSYRLLTMTGTHVAAGRAAGMSWGYAHELPHWLVVLGNTSIETFMVFIIYPLFVFSYQRLIVVGPLKSTMARVREAAESQRRSALKWGIPGLLLFVWFPFYMTGPVVGSVIGFLIGLKPWLNMAIVLLGTYAAILCWGILLQRIHRSLVALGPHVPFAFVSVVMLVVLSIHVRHAVSRSSHGKRINGGDHANRHDAE